jgi:hypothetical protein
MNGEMCNYFENLGGDKNVGKDERFVSMFASGALITAGLLRGSPLFVLAGAGFEFRALSGHCPVYEILEHPGSKPVRQSKLLIGE